MSTGEILLYTTEDGQTSIHLKTLEGTIWLTRTEIAELFQITPQNVTMHVRDIYNSGEVEAGSTSKDCLLVQNEGKRSITNFSRNANCLDRFKPNGEITFCPF